MSDPRFATVSATATANVDARSQVVVDTGSGVVTLDRLLPGGCPHTMAELISEWAVLRDPIFAAAAEPVSPDAVLDTAELSWQPPVAPQVLVAVGTNYRDHVREMSEAGGPPVMDEPFPFGFLKPTSCLVASDQPVAIPGYAQQLDWEVELAVVMGDTTMATTRDPLRAVFGYSVFNDLSVRDFLPFPHTLGLDAVVGKGFPGAAPMGPWITLAETISDVQRLPIQLRVNGQVHQNSSTDQMIFPVAEIVRHFARVLDLRPGDVIATGTPAGVGAGQRPPRFLAAGDLVEAEIGGLGSLRTPIVAGGSSDPLGSRKLTLAPAEDPESEKPHDSRGV